MIHLPVNDHETGEQHDQISAHSRLQCVEPVSYTHLTLPTINWV